MDFESTLALVLPNMNGATKRSKLERRLAAGIRRGSIFTACLNSDRTTYRLVTMSGTEYSKVTLKEADMICSFAMAAYNQGRAEA